MSSEVTAGLLGLLGAIVGGLISWWHQKDIARESNKTEYMAEKTARHFLNHKRYTDRSFELLQKRLGGFGDDELRCILVRAGAIRYVRRDGTEFWRLLPREPEAIAQAKAKGAAVESVDDDT